MNAVFNLNRWFLYLGKHWNENKRRYLLSLGAIGGLLVLWFSFLMIVKPNSPMELRIQVITYFVGLFLTGCLFGSMIFNDLSDDPKAIHYLLTPASALEKLLTAVVFGVVLFFIGYTIVFYAVDVIMLKVANGVMSSWLEQQHMAPKPQQELVNVFFPDDPGKELPFYIVLVFFEIQSIFLLGSVYFVRFQYIKTLVAGLIVFLMMVFFVHKVLGSFMPDGSFSELFSVYHVWNTSQGDVKIQLPGWLITILLFLTKYALAPCLWVVAYFRLKEKEV